MYYCYSCTQKRSRLLIGFSASRSHESANYSDSYQFFMLLDRLLFQPLTLLGIEPASDTASSLSSGIFVHSIR